MIIINLDVMMAKRKMSLNDLSEAAWFYVADRYYDDFVELNPGQSWTVPTEFTMEKYDFDESEYFSYTIESNS